MKLPFSPKIEKEEIRDLPLFSYDRELELIETKDQLKNLDFNLQKGEVIGFDTETKPAFKKGIFNDCALVQLALPEKVFLFRLNRIGFPDILRDLLSDNNYTKVGIAIHDDLKGLKDIKPFEPREFEDLNVLCPKIGFESIGAKKLSALVLGIQISKRQQVSNWEAKQLSDSQIKYAATDAWICREIYLKLQDQNLISRV